MRLPNQAAPVQREVSGAKVKAVNPSGSCGCSIGCIGACVGGICVGGCI